MIPLSNFINKSFSFGIFPNTCKLARVISGFKNEARQLAIIDRSLDFQILAKQKKN